MPDGRRVSGSYTATAAFPYIRGPEVVRWIKSWLRFGESMPVTVRDGPGGVVLVEAAAPRPVLAAPTAPVRRRVRLL